MNNQTEKKWYQKWWGIVTIIIVIVGIINGITNSSNSSSSGLSACECSQRWLSTPKSMMKSTDKWKYDECVRKYGGFAGANDACIKSK